MSIQQTVFESLFLEDKNWNISILTFSKSEYNIRKQFILYDFSYIHRVNASNVEYSHEWFSLAQVHHLTFPTSLGKPMPPAQ